MLVQLEPDLLENVGYVFRLRAQGMRDRVYKPLVSAYKVGPGSLVPGKTPIDQFIVSAGFYIAHNRQIRSYPLPSGHVYREETTGKPQQTRQISLVRLLFPHWKTLSLALVAVLGAGITDLLQPLPLKIVIDYVIGSKEMPRWMAEWFSFAGGTSKLAVLNLTALAVVAIAIIGAVSSYVQSVTTTSVGQWVMHDLRSTLYHHIQRLSLSFHDQSQTGDLISRVTNDIDTIQGFITSTLTDVILDILTLASMLAVMTYINWRFTLIALSVAPFLFIFVYKYSHRIKKASRAVRKKESEIVSKTQEVFSSIRVVKAFAREKYEKRRFKGGSLATGELGLKARAPKAGLSPRSIGLTPF